MNNHCCKLIFLSVCALITIPIVSIYYFEYLPKARFNDNCFKTNCVISGQLVAHKSEHCFNGLANVYFNDSHNLTKNRLLQIYGCKSESFILSKFIHSYVVNDTVECYYNPDSDEVVLDLYDLSINFDRIWLFLLIVFLSLFACMFFGVPIFIVIYESIYGSIHTTNISISSRRIKKTKVL